MRVTLYVVLMGRMHRVPTRPYRGIALPRHRVVRRVLKQSDCIPDTISEFVHALWLVLVVSHRPTQGFYPVFHDLRCPLYAVELGAVAEHGDDICRVIFPIANELEGDAPEHGHTDEGEARG